MLKIKILKSGKYALHPAYGGIIDFKKGDEFKEGDVLVDVEGSKDNASNDPNVLDHEAALRMENSGWAKLTEKKQEEKVPEPEKGPLDELLEILKDVKDDKEKKSKIQDWSSTHYGIKPSKSKSIDNMMWEIECHIKNNEPDPE